MLIFLARRSNHDPIFWPPDDKEEKVFDFCSTLISIVYFCSIYKFQFSKSLDKFLILLNFTFKSQEEGMFFLKPELIF